MTLSAPALSSTGDSTQLGGAQVDIDGTWLPVAAPAQVSGSVTTLTLEPASGALVRLQ